MAGNGTIGLELAEDLDEIDTVVIPWGGGGLTTGIASALRALRPETRIVRRRARDRSGQSRRRLRTTRADPGGVHAFVHRRCGLRRRAARHVGARRPARFRGIRDPTRGCGRGSSHPRRASSIVAEGAAGLAVAAALAGLAGSGRVVCIVCGGNIDSTAWARSSKDASRTDRRSWPRVALAATVCAYSSVPNERQSSSSADFTSNDARAAGGSALPPLTRSARMSSIVREPPCNIVPRSAHAPLCDQGHRVHSHAAVQATSSPCARTYSHAMPRTGQRNPRTRRGPRRADHGTAQRERSAQASRRSRPPRPGRHRGSAPAPTSVDRPCRPSPSPRFAESRSVRRAMRAAPGRGRRATSRPRSARSPASSSTR